MTPDLLMEQFERLNRAPGAIPRLRKFILDLGVRGKLVEQSTKDGSASELLASIKELKAQMVEEKQLRREQDVEYSLPTIVWRTPPAWVWPYIDDVAIVQGGKRLPSGATFSKEKTDHIYIRVTDMKHGTISTESLRYITPETQRAIARYTISQQDIYITIAGTIGQVGRVPKLFDGHNLTENAAKIVFRGLDPDYFCIVLSSDFCQLQFRDKTKQMAQPKLALKRILGAQFPLPPLPEQQRIAAKVHELMILCDQLELAGTEQDMRRNAFVAASNHNLTSADEPGARKLAARFYLDNLPRLTGTNEHINTLRKTILSLAIKGTLVLQDSGDNPPSEPLERIQERKHFPFDVPKTREERFVDLPEGAEIPFALPSDWQWVSLDAILESSFYGPRFGTEEYSQTGVPTIRTTDMTIDGRIELRDPPRVSLPAGRLDDFKCQKGDLLITRTGSIGVMAVFKGDYLAIPSAYLIRLRFTSGIVVDYIHTVLRSPYGQSSLGLNTTKVAQPNINAKNLRGILIPLPPRAEQSRIVVRVGELMKLCDELEARITTDEDVSRQLLEAILNEAINPAIRGEARDLLTN